MAKRGLIIALGLLLATAMWMEQALAAKPGADRFVCGEVVAAQCPLQGTGTALWLSAT